MHYHHFNQYHLGDCFPHLHFLRKLGMKHPEHTFNFYVNPGYFKELNPLIEDVMNVHLHPIENAPADSQNVWKNWGRIWERHPHRYQWALFHVSWFQFLSQRMGLECPIQKVSDLLFDYPAITSNTIPYACSSGKKVLINNAQPCSGQFRAYNSTDYLDPLIEAVATKCGVMTTQKSKTGVYCTRDFKMSCTDVGLLSRGFDAIIGIVNGPIWPTFCVDNAGCDKHWLFLRDNGEDMGLFPNEKHTTPFGGRELEVAPGLVIPPTLKIDSRKDEARLVAFWNGRCR
jgi:hypothetical protein